jgi:hypothetical protein
MMISHTPTRRLFLLGWLSIWSTGCAYTPDSMPPFRDPSSIEGGKAASRPKRSVSYDFGLGTNPPVAKKSTRYGENASSGDHPCHHPQQQPITQPHTNVESLARPLFVEAIAQYWVEHETGKAASRPKRSVSYDFGVGKNPPVAKSTRYGENASSEDHACHHPQQPITQPHTNVESSSRPLFVEAIAQYWVEHEAVREYPSPNRIIPATASKGKKRTYPVFIVPKRMTGDGILRIQGTHSLPSVIATHTPGRHFELNTPWVEMLIHEQQKKLAIAAP